MALTNFSLPFGQLTQPVHHWGATVSPLHPLAANTNNLLYSPADHQQQDQDNTHPPADDGSYYKNNPYAPPQLHQQQSQPYNNQYSSNNNNNIRRKGGNTYLPPIPPPGARNTQYHHQQQQKFSHFNAQQPQVKNNNNVAFKPTTASRTYGEGSYNRYPSAPSPSPSPSPSSLPPSNVGNRNQNFGYNTYSQTKTSTSTFNTQQKSIKQSTTKTIQNLDNQNIETPASTYGVADSDSIGGSAVNDIDSAGGSDAYPHQPPGFTRVQAGQGSRTQVHAVLDYDVEEGEEDYYDESDDGEEVGQDGSKKSTMPTVTPIQGPIFLKNGTVPVVPLLSYPTINNGSFVQIPIWWTALSVALGLDVRGDIIKGVPCVKRYHQLFCPTAGNSYPIEKIEEFIDENKALMRRMYGDFEMNLDSGGPRQQTKKRRRRFIDEPDIYLPPGVFPSMVSDDDNPEAGDTYFGKLREKRQSGNSNSRSTTRGGASFASTSGPRNIGPGSSTGSSTGRLDACESKVEIVTPYWAANSAGKIRAIVNTQHFEQAIHQEVCSKAKTSRCDKDCGCEQKYKWFRLLSYDPDNDCKGIFMDWFLFPSCCVCRCSP